MQILFQGGWRRGRDPVKSRTKVEEYCRSLAKHIVSSDYQIVLTSPSRYDRIIAQEIYSTCNKKGKNPKDHIVYLLSARHTGTPKYGRVFPYAKRRWQDERTYLVGKADALIAVGGGKGTSDCIQKAFLAQKPVFVAYSIKGEPQDAWRDRSADYCYLRKGDAAFIEDISLSADEFFEKVFDILGEMDRSVHPRRIFLVHGRDKNARDTLARVLAKLKFETVILQRQPNLGDTIIEKLERETESIGFGFILYTGDDIGYLSGKKSNARHRARQNVVFEHGLLVGLLGRKRVCALVKDDVELPSDLDGLLYTPFRDLEQESLTIAKILKEAKYDVNVASLV